MKCPHCGMETDASAIEIADRLIALVEEIVAVTN
jgi:hypothetical protein